VATDVVSREAQQQFPRWPIAAAKTIRVDLGPAGSGHIVDVSYGGIRVRSLAPLRREAELPLRIEVPDHSPVQCSGVVVWSKPNGGAGLKFTNLADDQKAILGAWLAELEQAASDGSPQKDEFARTTAQIAAMKLNNADALRLIARRVSHFSSASGVAIALGKPENMICLARAGEAPELGSAIRPGIGLVGECVRSRKVVICHDAAADPRAGELKQGSALIVPLLVNGELRGMMQVFSAQTHAFDTHCIETVGKLADAAIYVTHNVMPHRRPATVTPMPKPVASSAPLATKPSDSGRIRPFLAPPKPPVETVTPGLASSGRPMSVVSVAEISDIPVASVLPQARPVATANPTLELPHLEQTIAPKPAAALPQPVYHPRRQTPALWTLAPVAALLIAVPLGLYFWHHKQVAPVQAAAPVTTAPVASPVPAETAVVVMPVTPPSNAKPAAVSTESAKVNAAATSAAIEKPIPVIETAAHEKKAAPIEKEPEPAPLALSSGVPVARPKQVDESEATAPSAAHMPIATTTALPGVNLPAKVSAPKLTAPVSKPVTGGVLLQRIAPIYPKTAIAEGIEGEVQLQGVITERGTVENIRRISGHPLLVQAAMDAVRHWRYEPFKIDGQPVVREATITLNFKIPR